MEMDLANPDSIRCYVRETQPALIVNDPAYTAVDKAESRNPSSPWPSMVPTPGILAEEAMRLGAAIVHYSTDCIFDGNKDGPYIEEDAPNSLNVHGKTKLDGGELECGTISSDFLAHRESLVRGQIYKWRVQLERRERMARIETIAETEGVSIEQARRIRELEEELAATQQKLAQAVLEVDLLKKLQPNSPFASATSGYIDTKRQLARLRGRAK